MPHTDVVFHHQDGFGAAWQFRPLSVAGRGRRGNLREVDMHSSPFCELTLDGDVPAALANNSIAGSEAQPTAVTITFRGKERFEKMLLHFLAHPHAVINHANANLFAR